MRSIPLRASSRVGTGAKSQSTFWLRALCARSHSPKRAQPGWYCVLLLLFCQTGIGIAQARTYYLSPTGSDFNSGQSPSVPWLSPNHPLNCGDVIVAAASTSYSSANFYTGKWGTVTCPAKNNVAWLQCATFDGCKIHTNTNQGMWVDRSYWGVRGWEVTTTPTDTYGTCFIAQPNYASPTQIHHIIFANDIANGCSQGGFATVNHDHAGVDYFVVVGSIAYNAAQGSGTCASGISVYHPVQSDTVPGTHIYVANNFSYGNIDPPKCGGSSPTAGEGIVFGSFDGSQGGLTPYWSQAAAINNVVANNGGKGIEVNGNAGPSYHSTIWIAQNTSWGNLTDPNQSWLGCSEISLAKATHIHITRNLVSTKTALGCGGHPIYALGVSEGDGTDSVDHNLAYGYNGNNTFLYNSGSFAWGSTNQLGISPHFSKPRDPGPPRCRGTANVPSCMASVIADFVPLTASATSLGYQKPSSLPGQDQLFPQWLCTANLPAGLVTMDCK
jgi:hypothetical protein